MTLLTRLASDVQLMFRRPPRQQYAALCYRVKKKTGELELMLMTSRDTGRWVIPKGWPMPGKLSHEVAAQEALEEAGVRGTIEAQPLGTFGYGKTMKNGVKLECQVQVYALEVTGQAKNFKEKGERTLEWISPTEAAARVQEPGLRQMIDAFARRMADRAARAGTDVQQEV